jgi:hypothetical protein
VRYGAVVVNGGIDDIVLSANLGDAALESGHAGIRNSKGRASLRQAGVDIAGQGPQPAGAALAPEQASYLSRSITT